MTDPHPNTTANAQEWAKAINAGDTYLPQEWTDAAADLITDLTENWVSIKAMQEWRRKHNGSISDNALQDFADLIPAAPRTLADMTPEERAECQWMQVTDDVGNHVVLTALDEEEGEGKVLYENGGQFSWPYDILVPLPDLPRMVWPGDEDEPATPRPEDVPEGEPWQVEVYGQTAIGYRNDPEDMICWTVVYRDEADHDWMHDGDVTLIARLVPETTEQDDEPVLHPDYIYTDRDGDEWECIEGRWVTGDTHAERVAGRKVRPGLASLPEEYGPYQRDRLANLAEYGPYTRIEDTK